MNRPQQKKKDVPVEIRTPADRRAANNDRKQVNKSKAEYIYQSCNRLSDVPGLGPSCILMFFTQACQVAGRSPTVLTIHRPFSCLCMWVWAMWENKGQRAMAKSIGGSP